MYTLTACVGWVYLWLFSVLVDVLGTEFIPEEVGNRIGLILLKIKSGMPPPALEQLAAAMPVQLRPKLAEALQQLSRV